MRVVSAWVTIVHLSVEGADLVLTSHKQKSFKQTPHTACRDSEEQHLNLRDCEQTCDLFCWKLVFGKYHSIPHWWWGVGLEPSLQ